MQRSKYYLKKGGGAGGAYALRWAATALLRRGHSLHE